MVRKMDAKTGPEVIVDLLQPALDKRTKKKGVEVERERSSRYVGEKERQEALAIQMLLL